METGLDRQCDALVFVDVPLKERIRRVASSRGWTEEQLLSREKLQQPLDKKAKVAKYWLITPRRPIIAAVKSAACYPEFLRKIRATLAEITVVLTVITFG